MLTTKSVLKDRKTPIITKKKTFETYILPCLMYCAETITWRKDLLRKLDVFQNNIMRICTNKRKIDRMSINTLLMMTRLTPVSTLVKRKKSNMVRSSKKKRFTCQDCIRRNGIWQKTQRKTNSEMEKRHLRMDRENDSGVK